MSAQNVPLNAQSARRVVERAEALCRENRASLLFLTLVGSSLYGTRVDGSSDLDIRGLFLPNQESLALGEAPDSLRWSNGDAGRRNTACDIDLDLWSLRYWLLHLLPTGDLGALDLLFAPSHRACVLYLNPLVAAVFAHPERLANLASRRALDYSLAQAKKYGAKGARVLALRRVRDWLAGRDIADRKLADCLDELAEACADPRFCGIENVREGRALMLCGKAHLGHVRLADLAERVRAELDRYGDRARDAAGREGVDFKAIAHAARALFQIEELLQTGRIVFPLARAGELRAIRKGERPWEDLGPWLLDRLEAVKRAQETAALPCAYEADFARQCMLDCYGLAPKTPQAPAPNRP